LLISSISGCSKTVCPVPDDVIKYVYIERPIPDIEPMPVGQEYTVISVTIKGHEYYAIPRNDGLIMSSNWESFKSWAVTNYNILMNLKSSKDNNLSSAK